MVTLYLKFNRGDGIALKFNFLTKKYFNLILLIIIIYKSKISYILTQMMIRQCSYIKLEER